MTLNKIEDNLVLEYFYEYLNQDPSLVFEGEFRLGVRFGRSQNYRNWGVPEQYVHPLDYFLEWLIIKNKDERVLFHILGTKNRKIPIDDILLVQAAEHNKPNVLRQLLLYSNNNMHVATNIRSRIIFAAIYKCSLDVLKFMVDVYNIDLKEERCPISNMSIMEDMFNNMVNLEYANNTPDSDLAKLISFLREKGAWDDSKIDKYREEFGTP